MRIVEPSLNCAKSRLLTCVVILLITFSLMALMMFGCQANEKIEPVGSSKQTTNGTQDTGFPSDLPSQDPSPLQQMQSYFDSYPDLALDVDKTPETLYGYPYQPAAEKVIDVLLPEQNLSDFEKNSELIVVSSHEPNDYVYTSYLSKKDESHFGIGAQGDFDFDLNPKTSEDIDWMLPLQEDPLKTYDTRSKARQYFGDAELSFMSSEDAIALAEEKLRDLGYENIELFEVTALQADKIATMTEECKRMDEAVKEKYPNHQLYNFRLDWSEKDGKYVLLFQCLGTSNVAVESQTYLYDSKKLIRLGSTIGVYVGQRGVETIRVRGFRKFDGAVALERQLFDREVIVAKVANIYEMQPDVQEHMILCLRLQFLSPITSYTEELSSSLPYAPVYVVYVGELLKPHEQSKLPKMVDNYHFFDAVTGELLNVRMP